MKLNLRWAARGAIVAVALVATASSTRVAANSAARSDRMGGLPRVVLWAWERREDLGFIDPDRTAVAYLARTLYLSGDRVLDRPRLQPLIVPPRTRIIAVVRIESDRRPPPKFSAAQRAEAARIVAELADASVAAIQIDFDAPRSARPFYRDLLADVRTRVPASIPLSMTALASWCVYDNWIERLPVDEAVPMLFRMGADAGEVAAYLRDGGQFASAACRLSFGIAADEPIANLPAGRRVYLFSPRAWTRDLMRQAIAEAEQ